MLDVWKYVLLLEDTSKKDQILKIINRINESDFLTAERKEFIESQIQQIANLDLEIASKVKEDLSFIYE